MDPSSIIVAIDGPSGVGKSTVARRLATRLGVPYLDTGAMYRAFGLKVLRQGVDPKSAPEVEALLAATEVGLRADAEGTVLVLLDGEPVEALIRTPEVGQAASTVAAYPAVRRRMVALQQRCGERDGGVLEGRDIGTKVFPGTPHKFFLDARPEVRIDRRYRQLLNRGEEVSREEVAGEVTRRDHRDRSRGESPLAFDASYTRLDASELSVDEVVAALEDRIRSGSLPTCSNAAAPPG